MGSKLNQVPAYVVYDRSFDATITTIPLYNSVDLTEGTKGNSRDSNLTTYYETNATCPDLSNGGTQTTWDIGKIVFNGQVSYSIDYTTNGGWNSQLYLDYSTDAITWTNIITDTTTTTKNKYASLVVPAIRYLRSQYYSGSHAGQVFNTKFNEVRIMGSG